MKLVTNGSKDQVIGFLIEEYAPHGTTGAAEIKHEGEEQSLPWATFDPSLHSPFPVGSPTLSAGIGEILRDLRDHDPAWQMDAATNGLDDPLHPYYVPPIPS